MSYFHAIYLFPSNISDEEVHALAALLRNNTNIEELNLRGNNITDDGARALAAVLAGRGYLRLVDLRGNKIGQGAIKILAEALERAERVRHVYVHAGGKIEALGANVRSDKNLGSSMLDGSRISGGTGSDGLGMGEGDSKGGGTNTGTGMGLGGSTGVGVMVNVETVCVVDVRDNHPVDTTKSYELMTMEARYEAGLASAAEMANFKNGGIGSPIRFNPLMLLENIAGMPSKNGWDSSTVLHAIVPKEKDSKDIPGKKMKKKKGKKIRHDLLASESETSDVEKKKMKSKVSMTLFVLISHFSSFNKLHTLSVLYYIIFL